MGILDNIDRLVGGAVDRAFGEAVEYQPLAGGKISAASPDPNRAARTIHGVFAENPDAASPFLNRHHGTTTIGQTEVTLPGVFLSLSASTVSGMGYALRAGDRVVRGGSSFLVTGVMGDDLGAACLTLAREAKP